MKKEFCVSLVIYKDYNEMHGQQNIQWKGVVKQLKNQFVVPPFRSFFLQENRLRQYDRNEH